MIIMRAHCSLGLDPAIQASQITVPKKRHSAVTRAEDTVLKAYE